jgi:hypothetical protein
LAVCGLFGTALHVDVIDVGEVDADPRFADAGPTEDDDLGLGLLYVVRVSAFKFSFSHNGSPARVSLNGYGSHGQPPHTALIMLVFLY